MTDLAVSLPQGRGGALGDHLRAFAQRLAQWCGHACHVDMDLQYPGSGWAGHDPDIPPGGYPPGSAVLDKRTQMKHDPIDAELRAAFRELNEAAPLWIEFDGERCPDVDAVHHAIYGLLMAALSRRPGDDEPRGGIGFKLTPVS